MKKNLIKRKRKIEPYYLVLSVTDKIQGAFPFTPEGKRLAKAFAKKLQESKNEKFKVK